MICVPDYLELKNDAEYAVTIFLSHSRINRYRRKKRGVDYNAEIPFERKPAPGLVIFYLRLHTLFQNFLFSYVFSQMQKPEIRKVKWHQKFCFKF